MCLVLHNTTTSLPELFTAGGVEFYTCYKDFSLYHNNLVGFYMRYHTYSFEKRSVGLKAVPKETEQEIKINLYGNERVTVKLKLGYHAKGFPYPELWRPMLSSPKPMNDEITLPVFIHPDDLQIVNKYKQIVAKSFWLLDPEYFDMQKNFQIMHRHPFESDEEIQAYEEVYSRIKKGLKP